MRTWIFAGICDKSDMLLYLCKILAQDGKRILLADAARERKYAHCIGRLDPCLDITEFSGFDVACGFEDCSALMDRLGRSEEAPYDLVVIDVEKESFMKPQDWQGADAMVWVSSFELTGLMKGDQWLKGLSEGWEGLQPPGFQRVYLNAIEDMTDDAYIDSYLGRAQVRWLDEPIRIPWDELSYALKIENEHAGRLRIKPLGRTYKRALMELIQRLTEMERRHIRRAMKQAERRRA
ncbi:hypothetical protein [Paenibacillus sp. DMB20]|uniref:hypothetical protein n=1 Tax=Paenibacillus sp. DMB20 TaxID=1642570 RepID=UPI000627B393|nr:hypothetical protein [Paenibacillus sp. DMB20]KKO55517.1 hypothetical protein XI25_00120 [Paenibacillus sp. DMB20]